MEVFDEITGDSRQDDPEACLNQNNKPIKRKKSRKNLIDRLLHINKENFTKDGIKRLLESNKLHILVILLVILDCVCISIELTLDLIISINNESREKSKAESHQNSTTKTNLNLFRLLYSIDPKIISILQSIEHTLKFFGLAILAFFVIEISLKLIFIPREILKSIWGMLDAIVVFVSFILDILLLKNKQLLHTVTGLLTLFRLWRIARILSGILMTMEKKSSKKLDKLSKRIESLKKENNDLKDELEQNRLLIENLMNNKNEVNLTNSLQNC